MLWLTGVEMKTAKYLVGPYTFNVSLKGRIRGLNNYIYRDERELLQESREHGGLKVTRVLADGTEEVLYDPASST
jgi:hypothetical protein